LNQRLEPTSGETSKLRVTLLGTGTSQGVPVIGCHCDVCSSSDPRDQRLRSSVLLRKNDTSVVIDIGPDFRQQMLKFKVDKIEGIAITHEHNDHVIGLDEVRPFNYQLQRPVNVYAEDRVLRELRTRFAYAFVVQRVSGLPEIELSSIEPGEAFTIGDITLLPIRILHGQLPILGFRVDDFTYLTDVKYIDPLSIEAIKGSKVVVISALHHRPHHSHITLTEAIEMAEKLGAPQTYFTHISHQMGKYTDVNPMLPEGTALAYDGLELVL